MRGNVYRLGRRRTVSVVLGVVAGVALGLALILGSAVSVYAKPRPAQTRSPVVVVAAVSHQAAVKLKPIAHAAGHKIA